MAVSYLTQQPFVSSAPIPSIDLNLMASVLQQKQSQFDANFTKAQTQISNIASLEMLKDDDIAYRDSKINELVKNLNSNIGTDFSDPNVSSQIDGSISSLFSDGRIINAVSSTKNVRSLQASYQKMMSDPKMAKYYSDANYDADMEEVNRYLTSKDPNDKYQGKSSATLFSSYMPDLTKTAQSLKASGWQRLEDGTDGYYNVNSGKILTSEQISNNIMGVLDSNQKAQLARDAKYLWGKKLNLQPKELIDKITNTTTQKITMLEQQLKSTESLKDKLSSTDAALRDEQIKSYKETISALKSRKISIEKQYNEYLQNGGSLDGLRFMAYEDDLSKTLGNLFSYSETKTDRKVDVYKLETIKSMNRQNELRLAAKLRYDLERDKAAWNNNGKNNEAVTIPVPTKDNTQQGIAERFEFNNQQADIYEEQAVGLYNASPDIKNYKAILNGVAQGRNVGISKLPVNMDENVIKHNILSFGALRSRIAGNRDESMYKQYDTLGIDESKMNDATLTSVKASLVKDYPDILKSTTSFRVVNINQSTKQFRTNPDTKKLEIDDDFYATVEVKNGGDWVQLEKQIKLPDNVVAIYSNGKLSKQNLEQRILNNGVDETNQFATSIQSKANPNVVSNISVIKEKNGMFETYIQIDGKAVPLSGLTTKKIQSMFAWDAYTAGLEFARSLKSVDELRNYAKNYVQDANLDTKRIKFGNHSIYAKTPKPPKQQVEAAPTYQPSFFSDR